MHVEGVGELLEYLEVKRRDLLALNAAHSPLGDACALRKLSLRPTLGLPEFADPVVWTVFPLVRWGVWSW